MNRCIIADAINQVYSITAEFSERRYYRWGFPAGRWQHGKILGKVHCCAAKISGQKKLYWPENFSIQ
jgi:hypothetical protein